jgi:hypothetical protein
VKRAKRLWRYADVIKRRGSLVERALIYQALAATGATLPFRWGVAAPSHRPSALLLSIAPALITV